MIQLLTVVCSRNKIFITNAVYYWDIICWSIWYYHGSNIQSILNLSHQLFIGIAKSKVNDMNKICFQFFIGFAFIYILVDQSGSFISSFYTINQLYVWNNAKKYWLDIFVEWHYLLQNFQCFIIKFFIIRFSELSDFH